MSDTTAPPPTYTQQSEDLASHSNVPSEASDPQLLISPSPNAFHFQKGYLGADGERAAIEGELQVKGIHSDTWEAATISLRSVESVGQHHVELNLVDVELFSRSTSSSSVPSTTLPSSMPFSIPLTLDTPQCVHTIKSSLSHTLTATLHPVDHSVSPVTRTLTVHTRRYTSHLLKFQVSPHTLTLNDPTLVEVQVPRTTYRTDEPIPVYVTIPPPERSVVLDQGFTLRNVRAELVRTVTVFHNAHDIDNHSVADSDLPSDSEPDDSSDGSSSSDGEAPSAAFMAAPEKAFFSRPSPSLSTSEHVSKQGTSYQTVLSRSGASCRFHSSRPVRLRLVLHKSLQTSSPTTLLSDLPGMDHSQPENDTQCASISQSTLMHSVAFSLHVNTTFVHASNRTERVSTLSVPITLLPGPAPLPEVDPSIDAAYRKKHDRPPTKTVRREESEAIYVELGVNQAGPSAVSGAPPPFDEAPPPFSTSFPEASTSSRLPTFLESESEVLVLSEDHPAAPNSLPPRRLNELSLEGEGILFGFSPSDQYDGHSDEMQRSSTPPPSLEMARGDTDVTELAGLINQPSRALEALNMAMEHHEEQTGDGDLPPPPPPPMDDPSDPPPSIDSDYRSHASDPPPSIHSEFRSPGRGISPPHSSSPPPQQSSSPPPDLPPGLNEPSAAGRNQTSESAPSVAPPPYLNPTNAEEHEHVTRPPPYVDLLPSAEDLPSHR